MNRLRRRARAAPRAAQALGTARHASPLATARGAVAVAIVAILVPARGAFGQTLDDYRGLFVNEILASNDGVGPTNWLCEHVDMLELYNASGVDLPLDHPELGHVRLTDGSRFDSTAGNPDPPERFVSFRRHNVSLLPAGERLVIFCDASVFSDVADRSAECAAQRAGIDDQEVHAPFRLGAEGETVRLELVPRNGDAPIVLDEVTYPPLAADISYARVPEDRGNLTEWVFSDEPTLGACAATQGPGSACVGGTNTGGSPLEPDVNLIDYQTNNPAAGEAAAFRVRVTDEKGAGADNIRRVALRYRVDGGTWQETAMALLALVSNPDQPLDEWSIWEGSVPGQAGGARVEVAFLAEDADGQGDVSPSDELDLFRYTVGSSYDGPLVINEVIANNDTLLEDPSEASQSCNSDNPTCRYDDFIELYNASGEAVSLEGMILARGALRPQRGWRFPAGSQIGPRQYLIVWVDEDGTEGAADDPTDPATEAYHTSFRLDADRDELFLFDRDQAGNQVIDGVRWGTSTIEPYYGRLDGDPDHDPTQPVVPPFMPPPASGTADPLPADHSLARLPDGRRTSPFVLRAAADATPAQSNAPPGGFRRGDANLTGFLEMADAISVLGYLFLGQGERPCLDALDADDSGDVAIADATAILGYLLLGATAPPPPGPDACGPDGTPDDPLPACDYSACGSP